MIVLIGLIGLDRGFCAENLVYNRSFDSASVFEQFHQFKNKLTARENRIPSAENVSIASVKVMKFPVLLDI